MTTEELIEFAEANGVSVLKTGILYKVEWKKSGISSQTSVPEHMLERTIDRAITEVKNAAATKAQSDTLKATMERERNLPPIRQVPIIRRQREEPRVVQVPIIRRQREEPRVVQVPIIRIHTVEEE